MRRIQIISTVLAGAVAGAIVALVIGTGHNKTVTVTDVQAGSASSGSGASTTANANAGSAPVSTPSASSSGLSVNQIYKKDSAGVVDILVTSTGSSESGSSGSGSGSGGLGGGGLFSPSQSQQSEDEGAGVVYDTKGDIVTDEHVVSGATKVVVNFQNGVTAKAKVLGTDPSTDMAVIRVEGVKASQLHPIAFSNSSTAQVGDQVVAIGSPFSLPETVTAGIVSAVGRTIGAPNGFNISGAIQTDAAINPGNSGGPLLDGNGSVLGLNDQIQTSSGDSAGIGFATPGNTDVQVANKIISGKSVTHAYVGVCVQNATSGSGAEVAPSASSSCPTPVVAGGPADKAGLQPGDVVTAINGQNVTGSDGFVQIINNFKPGQTVTFTVKSANGKTHKVKVTLGTRPKTAPTAG